ncbi:Cellulose synthase-like protein E6 [Camellia lanceoleosa]|uniref:Cellulose synthase-like protein E6 n=1 Tax=Camellia lanceoleosa TaxID=1840588 RepID=A0ACC0I4K8_9ERIC|nr:Cellulose synthase-like protein E6 [Camellia lanceoleosa]
MKIASPWRDLADAIDREDIAKFIDVKEFDKDDSTGHLFSDPVEMGIYINQTDAIQNPTFVPNWSPQNLQNSNSGTGNVASQASNTTVDPAVDEVESAMDDDGHQLPTPCTWQQKRDLGSHNFKAGSMNALIRVSSEISNAPIILNLDCDMYSNDSDAIKEALCFFMDEKHGHKTSYVQHPQSYNNITKNDIYSNVASTTHLIELAGIDGYNAALYCGTGCFHRRESLCGLKYSENYIGRCVVCIERHLLVYEPMLSRFANEGGLIGSSPAEVSKGISLL